jgi:uncharacterized repeat protein (TIGR01451 family)
MSGSFTLREVHAHGPAVPLRFRLPAPPRLLVALAASVGLALAVSPASASTACTPAAQDILSPSCFEGADGNLVTDNADGVGRFDWSTMTSVAGAPITVADDTLDSRFEAGNSAKEESPGDWVLGTGNVQNKTDLAASAIRTDPVSGDVFFYGAFARPTPQGAVNVSFELNRVAGRWDLRAPGGPELSPTGVPYRSNGDLLVTFDGSGTEVDVGLCRWFGGPEVGYDGYLGQATGGDPSYGWRLLDGTALAQDCTLVSTVSLATRTGHGAMNTDPLNGVSAILPSFPDSLVAGAFGEVSVNLSQGLATLTDPEPCFAFNSVWLRSRSAPAANAGLVDFVQPVALSGAKNCSLAVDKRVAVNDATGPYAQVGAGTTFAAEPSWASPGDTLHYEIAATNDGHETVASPTPADPQCAAAPTIVDADKTQTSAPAGADTSPATFDPGDTWVFRCSSTVPANATAPIDNTATVSGTVGVAPGVVTTVTASDSTRTAILARLEVRKVVVGGAPADFDFTTSADLLAAGTFTLTSGNTRVFAGLRPNAGPDAGTNVYSVAETVPAGYSLTSLVCRTGPSEADPVVDPDPVSGAGATVSLTQGETQYCTFTNTKDARVTIVKDAGGADGQDVTFATAGALPGAPSTFLLDDDADPTLEDTEVFTGLGTFGVATVTETLTPDRDLAGIACVDALGATAATVRSGVMDNGAFTTGAADASRDGFDAGDTTVEIDVQPGVDVTCTFSNVAVAASLAASTTTPAITAGEDAAFTVTFTNAGPGAARNVVIDDLLPAGLTWAPDGALPPGCTLADVVVGAEPRQRMTCTTASLGVGSLTFTVRATTSATACGTYVNEATLSGGNLTGGSASATVTCTVPAATVPVPDEPAPVVAGQSAAPAPVVAGQSQSLAPAETATPLPGTVAAARSTGTARLRGPSGCLSGASSRVYVTGRQILSVRFVLNGRTYRTVRRADRQGRWMTTVRRSALRRGAHRVQAVVTFRAASRTRSRTLQIRFSRCVARIAPERARGLTG